ncbi:group II intron maturase-specific domain-containing protein [Aedoeadaptatus ivorii]|uniref:group II intron maturase-specific domain-containing protein n=1 Tax=Aedoeadaptatus ivorii TaxID=54006 RepID=UPI0038994201
MDRIIQQAIVQVLTPIIEQKFSEYSYGFRPRRNCEMAIVKLLEYFIGDMKTNLTKIDEHLRTRLRMIIWKMWKVASKRQWGVQKLGVNKDLTRLTSYVGNRYYFVVTKTCVVRSISKEILTRRGLVSCLDYYTERRNVRFN